MLGSKNPILVQKYEVDPASSVSGPSLSRAFQSLGRLWLSLIGGSFEVLPFDKKLEQSASSVSAGFGRRTGSISCGRSGRVWRLVF